MPIIKNFGFLWERKYIKRGSGGAGNAGCIDGFRDGDKNTLIDFSDQIGVYALYDENRSIIYVGQAGNGKATLFARLKQHMKGSNLWNRWMYFSWVGFRNVLESGHLRKTQSVNARISGFKYGDALNEIEGILIELLEPKLNKQGGKLKKAIEYFQNIPDEPVTMESLKDEIDELANLVKTLQK